MRAGFREASPSPDGITRLAINSPRGSSSAKVSRITADRRMGAATCTGNSSEMTTFVSNPSRRRLFQGQLPQGLTSNRPEGVPVIRYAGPSGNPDSHRGNPHCLHFMQSERFVQGAMRICRAGNQGKRIWEGEAPVRLSSPKSAEPKPIRKSRLGGSLALPFGSNDFALGKESRHRCGPFPDQISIGRRRRRSSMLPAPSPSNAKLVGSGAGE